MVIVALTLPGKMPGLTFLPTNSTSTLGYLFHHVIRDKRFSHVFHPSADIFSRFLSVAPCPAFTAGKILSRVFFLLFQ